MGTLEELLQNPAYRHVALNHIPVTGLLVAWIVLLIGVLSRQRFTAALGLALVAATAASAAIVMPAGEDAYPLVYETLDGPGRQRLERHADLAGVWGLGLYATAALAIVALATALARSRHFTAAAATVTVSTLGVLVSVFVIAAAGGEIRHPEFRARASADLAAPARGGPVAMRRLTEPQYRAAITAAFGPEIEVIGRFEPEMRRSGLLAVGNAQTTVTAVGFEDYEAMAFGVAAQVVAPDQRERLVPCRPAGPTTADDACAEKFVRRYGPRLLRRPLEDREVQARVAAAGQTARAFGDFHAGLEVAVASLLVAPDFLFRIERAETASDDPDRLHLTAETLASRLSYFVWNDGPDDALLAAAAQGDLSDPEEWSKQIDRLLDSPRVEEGTRAFFADLLRFDEFAGIGKDPIRYPIYTGRLALDAREQTLRVLVDHLVARKGDYRDLFTTRRSFMTRSLGPLYGVPVRTSHGWEEMEFPAGHPRAGLLSHASLLMLHAHPGRSSATLRGQFLREAILCQTVPPAPADVEFALFNDDQSEEHKTARDRLAVHNATASCRSCHQRTDPIGLGLERFDGVGKYRTTENEATIDASGTLDGTTFRDNVELGTAFRNHPRLAACAVENLYRYAVGRDVVDGERGLLRRLETEFAASGHRWKALLGAIARSDGFRTAAPETRPPPVVEARTRARSKETPMARRAGT